MCDLASLAFVDLLVESPLASIIICIDEDSIICKVHLVRGV